ncbi:MAG: MBOAT family protein [Clostridia bacterium]|nr:MBOAT family protein [Clostridia bacterium]
MLFSSYSFLFLFLPPLLALYFLPMLLARQGGRLLKWQNGVLLLASLLFYAWGEPLYLLLMLGVVLADTLFGLWLVRARHKRTVLTLAVSLHILLLFYFKYAAFFAYVCGFSLQQPHLPLGISFYTFQALSYVADVYRGRVAPQKNPALLGLYVALFPQLIAGPIVCYRDVAAALERRHHSLLGATEGIRRFAAGLAKKLLLANPMGALFALLIGRELSLLGAWTALLAFSFQLYFDFSGYSDMAVGLGRIFGFRFPENFRYPYIARSITDFWRRWHITLSSFFRDYVYIPLGGSRKGAWRTLLNLLVVWSLTGLWHGAAWNFILWGLYYFLLLALERFVLRRFFRPAPGVIAHGLTLLAVLLGWALFAFDGSSAALSFSALGRFLPQLLGANGLWQRSELYDILRHLPLLLLCAIGSTPLPRQIYRQTVCKKRLFWLRTALPLLALLLSVIDLSDAGFNPFLYFRF